MSFPFEIDVSANIAKLLNCSRIYIVKLYRTFFYIFETNQTENIDLIVFSKSTLWIKCKRCMKTDGNLLAFLCDFILFFLQDWHFMECIWQFCNLWYWLIMNSIWIQIQFQKTVCVWLHETFDAAYMESKDSHSSLAKIVETWNLCMYTNQIFNSVNIYGF